MTNDPVIMLAARPAKQPAAWQRQRPALRCDDPAIAKLEKLLVDSSMIGRWLMWTTTTTSDDDDDDGPMSDKIKWWGAKLMQKPVGTWLELDEPANAAAPVKP